MTRTLKLLFLCLALALVLTGMSSALFQTRARAQTTGCEQTYVVQAGDWLSKIAQKFYNDAKAYTTIFDGTNAAAKTDSSFATLTSPNVIVAGQKLCIPASTTIPGRESAGVYTNVGPAADASALVETIVLGPDGQARDTLDYVGKSQNNAKGTWSQAGNVVTVVLTEQDGQPISQTTTYTVTDGNLVGTNPPNTVYTKTSPDVVFLSGVYTTNRSSFDGSQTLTSLTLLPNGQASLTISQGTDIITQTGTWTAGTDADTKAQTVTVNLTKQGDQTINETFAFQVQGDALRGTQYDTNKWGTSLTFTKYQAPSQPETPASAAQAEGIYTNVGPAADASALVETIALGPGGKATDTLDYVGKSQNVATGTWSQAGNIVTVVSTEQDGQPISQTSTYTVTDGNLVGTNPPNTVYTKTAADVVLLSGVYTTNRASADGSQTLTSLTLLPNGTASLTISQGTDILTQTGTWTAGVSADTGAQTVTVSLTQQGTQTISESYTFQVQGDALRGTEYDRNKWGTDLTFTKYHAPSQPETPASAAMQNGVGSYTAQLPAADAVGRVIVLNLAADGKAEMTTQFIGKGEPTVDAGTWVLDAGNYAVTLNSSSGTQKLVFAPQGNTIVLQDPTAAGYGSDGLTLTKTPSGQTNSATFGGVNISFDQDLAQSAEGALTKAVPVTEGPALGGATPASIRFLFDGGKTDDFFSPTTAQVLVYKTEDWVKLDPYTAKMVSDLQAMLKAKPTTFDTDIPVLPPLPATQVFRAKPEYLDFKNGTGVGFLTYYAQDVSPVLASQLFYTFQGLTNDGKYYVAVFYPVTTALLPTDPTAALGGASYEEWAKNYQNYIKQLVSDLNGLIPAAYTPDLNLVHGLTKSIEVGDAQFQ